MVNTHGLPAARRKGSCCGGILGLDRWFDEKAIGSKQSASINAIERTTATILHRSIGLA
jgi:hypothetical protein